MKLLNYNEFSKQKCLTFLIDEVFCDSYENFEMKTKSIFEEENEKRKKLWENSLNSNRINISNTPTQLINFSNAELFSIYKWIEFFSANDKCKVVCSPFFHCYEIIN